MKNKSNNKSKSKSRTKKKRIISHLKKSKKIIYTEKPIIIYNINDIESNVKENINFKNKQRVFVFDIHRTTLTPEGECNIDAYNLIKKLKKNNNIVFLSFDGNDKRIIENNNKINKIKLYKNIPRIFIKKRYKQLVAKSIYEIIKLPKNIKQHVMLIDDNYNNIIDVKKLKNEKIVPYYYTKYVKSKHIKKDKGHTHFNLI